MSLATRLSAFFLVALALVLAGFSGTLYVLARTYLVGQLDERLQHALDTLEASVDIEPGGLEWEPADRRMTLGVEPGTGAVRWAVRDGRGALVDRSANASPGRFPRPTGRRRPGPRTRRTGRPSARCPGWRLAARRLQLDGAAAAGPRPPGRRARLRGAVSGAGPGRRPGAGPGGGDAEPAGPDAGRAVGRRLGGGGGRGAAALPPRLAPVSRMARAATAMTAADLGQRLPAPGTGDELDELGRAFNDLLDRLHEAFVRLNEALRPAAAVRRRRLAPAPHAAGGPARAGPGRAPPRPLAGGIPAGPGPGPGRGRPPAADRRIAAPAGPARGRPARARGGRPRRLGARPPPPWSAHPRAADLRPSRRRRRPMVVRVHPPLLAQLVDNLLENACKYSEPGTPIVVRAWREDGVGRPGRRGPGLRPGGRRVAACLRAVLPGRAGAPRGASGRRPRPGRGAADRRHLRGHARGPERARAGSLFILRLPAAAGSGARAEAIQRADRGRRSRADGLSKRLSGAWPMARLSRNWARL